MTPQEAQGKFGKYAAFAPFLTDEAQARPVWSVAQITEALRSGPRPTASERFVRDACEKGELRAVNYGGNVGWSAYREDLYDWLASYFLPGNANASA
jgi:hypothetical protein